MVLECLTDKPPSTHIKCLRVLNLLNGLAVIFAGGYGIYLYFKSINDQEDFTPLGICFSFFAIVFGSFIVCFEGGRVGSEYATKNFGFMQNFCGRALLFVFIAVLLFDKDTFGTPGLIVGIVTCVNAAWQVFLMLVHKDIGVTYTIEYGADK